MKKTYIIAEVGINHNGNLDLAKKLIMAAKSAGVDAVKFQKRTIERVYTKEELSKFRESPWGKTNRAQKEGLEFNKQDYDEIDAFCKRENIFWFASCWDLESFEFIKQYNCKYNKVASALLTHISLLEAIAKEKKYTFISTGMSTIEEITKAVEIFQKYECPFCLMHCNAQYPAPEKVLNLNVISTLKSLFKCAVGYSCHSTGIIPAVAAVAMGATSIEKHITLDRAMYGSDQAASVEPGGFLRMVDYIRTVEDCLGDGIKHVTEAEEKCKAKLRREGDVEYQ